MSPLSKGSLINLNHTNGDPLVIKFNQNTIKFGSNIISDVVIPEADKLHCEISIDSFGRIWIINHNINPIVVNGKELKKKRPLVDGAIIEIVNQKFCWKANVLCQPLSEPSKPSSKSYKKVQKMIKRGRFTIHNIAFTDDPEEDIIVNMEHNTDVSEEHILETKNLITEHHTPKILKKDDNLSHKISSNEKENIPFASLELSSIIQTSYSPQLIKTSTLQTPIMQSRRGTPKTPTSVYKTPTNVYKTPLSIFPDVINSSFGENDAKTTPRQNSALYSFTEIDDTPKNSTSAIDLVTPDIFQTPKTRSTSLLKSALKNSALKTPKSVVSQVKRFSVVNESHIENESPNSTKLNYSMRSSTLQKSRNITEESPNTTISRKSTVKKVLDMSSPPVKVTKRQSFSKSLSATPVSSANNLSSPRNTYSGNKKKMTPSKYAMGINQIVLAHLISQNDIKTEKSTLKTPGKDQSIDFERIKNLMVSPRIVIGNSEMINDVTDSIKAIGAKNYISAKKLARNSPRRLPTTGNKDGKYLAPKSLVKCTNSINDDSIINKSSNVSCDVSGFLKLDSTKISDHSDINFSLTTKNNEGNSSRITKSSLSYNVKQGEKRYSTRRNYITKSDDLSMKTRRKTIAHLSTPKSTRKISKGIVEVPRYSRRSVQDEKSQKTIPNKNLKNTSTILTETMSLKNKTIDTNVTSPKTNMDGNTNENKNKFCSNEQQIVLIPNKNFSPEMDSHLIVDSKEISVDVNKILNSTMEYKNVLHISDIDDNVSQQNKTKSTKMIKDTELENNKTPIKRKLTNLGEKTHREEISNDTPSTPGKKLQIKANTLNKSESNGQNSPNIIFKLCETRDSSDASYVQTPRRSVSVKNITQSLNTADLSFNTSTSYLSNNQRKSKMFENSENNLNNVEAESTKNAITIEHEVASKSIDFLPDEVNDESLKIVENTSPNMIDDSNATTRRSISLRNSFQIMKTVNLPINTSTPYQLNNRTKSRIAETPETNLYNFEAKATESTENPITFESEVSSISVVIVPDAANDESLKILANKSPNIIEKPSSNVDDSNVSNAKTARRSLSLRNSTQNLDNDCLPFNTSTPYRRNNRKKSKIEINFNIEAESTESTENPIAHQTDVSSKNVSILPAEVNEKSLKLLANKSTNMILKISESVDYSETSYLQAARNSVSLRTSTEKIADLPFDTSTPYKKTAELNQIISQIVNNPDNSFNITAENSVISVTTNQSPVCENELSKSADILTNEINESFNTSAKDISINTNKLPILERSSNQDENINKMNEDDIINTHIIKEENSISSASIYSNQDIKEVENTRRFSTRNRDITKSADFSITSPQKTIGVFTTPKSTIKVSTQMIEIPRFSRRSLQVLKTNKLNATVPNTSSKNNFEILNNTIDVLVKIDKNDSNEQEVPSAINCDSNTTISSLQTSGEVNNSKKIHTRLTRKSLRETSILPISDNDKLTNDDISHNINKSGEISFEVDNKIILNVQTPVKTILPNIEENSNSAENPGENSHNNASKLNYTVSNVDNTWPNIQLNLTESVNYSPNSTVDKTQCKTRRSTILKCNQSIDYTEVIGNLFGTSTSVTKNKSHNKSTVTSTSDKKLIYSNPPAALLNTSKEGSLYNTPEKLTDIECSQQIKNETIFSNVEICSDKSQKISPNNSFEKEVENVSINSMELNKSNASNFETSFVQDLKLNKTKEDYSMSIVEETVFDDEVILKSSSEDIKPSMSNTSEIIPLQYFNQPNEIINLCDKSANEHTLRNNAEVVHDNLVNNQKKLNQFISDLIVRHVPTNKHTATNNTFSENLESTKSNKTILCSSESTEKSINILQDDNQILDTGIVFESLTAKTTNALSSRILRSSIHRKSHNVTITATEEQSISCLENTGTFLLRDNLKDKDNTVIIATPNFSSTDECAQHDFIKDTETFIANCANTERDETFEKSDSPFPENSKRESTKFNTLSHSMMSGQNINSTTDINLVLESDSDLTTDELLLELSKNQSNIDRKSIRKTTDSNSTAVKVTTNLKSPIYTEKSINIFESLDISKESASQNISRTTRSSIIKKICGTTIPVKETRTTCNFSHNTSELFSNTSNNFASTSASTPYPKKTETTQDSTNNSSSIAAIIHTKIDDKDIEILKTPNNFSLRLNQTNRSTKKSTKKTPTKFVVHEVSNIFDTDSPSVNLTTTKMDNSIIVEVADSTTNINISTVNKTLQTHKNELENFVGVKELMKTPLRNDLRDVRGVKELMKTPIQNDLSDLRGIKELVNTPYRDDLTDVRGVKELLKTPYITNPSDLRGIKELMNTPYTDDLTDVRGVKEIFNTPYRDSFTDVVGVKELMNTPMVNDLLDGSGVKELMKSPGPVAVVNKIDNNKCSTSSVTKRTNKNKHSDVNETNEIEVFDLDKSFDKLIGKTTVKYTYSRRSKSVSPNKLIDSSVKKSNLNNDSVNLRPLLRKRRLYSKDTYIPIDFDTDNSPKTGEKIETTIIDETIPISSPSTLTKAIINRSLKTRGKKPMFKVNLLNTTHEMDNNTTGVNPHENDNDITGEFSAELLEMPSIDEELCHQHNSINDDCVKIYPANDNKCFTLTNTIDLTMNAHFTSTPLQMGHKSIIKTPRRRLQIDNSTESSGKTNFSSRRTRRSNKTSESSITNQNIEEHHTVLNPTIDELSTINESKNNVTGATPQKNVEYKIEEATNLLNDGNKTEKPSLRRGRRLAKIVEATAVVIEHKNREEEINTVNDLGGKTKKAAAKKFTRGKKDKENILVNVNDDTEKEKSATRSGRRRNNDSALIENQEQTERNMETADIIIGNKNPPLRRGRRQAKLIEATEIVENANKEEVIDIVNNSAIDNQHKSINDLDVKTTKVVKKLNRGKKAKETHVDRNEEIQEEMPATRRRLRRNNNASTLIESQQIQEQILDQIESIDTPQTLIENEKPSLRRGRRQGKLVEGTNIVDNAINIINNSALDNPHKPIKDLDVKPTTAAAKKLNRGKKGKEEDTPVNDKTEKEIPKTRSGRHRNNDSSSSALIENQKHKHQEQILRNSESVDAQKSIIDLSNNEVEDMKKSNVSRTKLGHKKESNDKLKESIEIEKPYKRSTRRAKPNAATILENKKQEEQDNTNSTVDKQKHVDDTDFGETKIEAKKSNARGRNKKQQNQVEHIESTEHDDTEKREMKRKQGGDDSVKQDQGESEPKKLRRGRANNSKLNSTVDKNDQKPTRQLRGRQVRFDEVVITTEKTKESMSESINESTDNVTNNSIKHNKKVKRNQQTKTITTSNEITGETKKRKVEHTPLEESTNKQEQKIEPQKRTRRRLINNSSSSTHVIDNEVSDAPLKRVLRKKNIL